MPVLSLLITLLLTGGSATASEDSLFMNRNIPVIEFPGIAQEDFNDAFNVLNECVVKAPGYGFPYPFIAPGGHYGGCWWQLDASISLHATKWINQGFSENMLRGFIAVQKPDGRIPLYGHDKVPDYPTCSSLPKLFQAAYAVLKHSGDNTLLKTVYPMLYRYWSWWFSDARRDAATGLITGIFEESFPPIENRLKTTAQVDLNVELATACQYMAELASRLGLQNDKKRFLNSRLQLVGAINRYMWNEKLSGYTSFDVIHKSPDSTFIVSAFDPLVSNIAPYDRAVRMVQQLTNDQYFNWHTRPLTSVAKTASIYNETTGAYNGAPAWSGSIWSLRNYVAVQGLEDVGRYDLAAYLALKTVRSFNKNYYEFLKPSDGSGHGVKRYAWSAAQYIQLLVEDIFGINYNRFTGEIQIIPNLCASLKNEKIALRNLKLPDESLLNVEIEWKENSVRIHYAIHGNSQISDVVVGWRDLDHTSVKATDKAGKRRRMFRSNEGNAVIHKVYNKNKPANTLLFSMHR